jgi:hypothetical protein
MFGRQVLGNRESLFVHKEQAVAIFVDLHVIAGADPGAVLNFFFLARVEPARTERFAQGVDIVGQAQYHGLRDLWIRMGRSAGFRTVLLNEFSDPLNALFGRSAHKEKTSSTSIDKYLKKINL